MENCVILLLLSLLMQKIKNYISSHFFLNINIFKNAHKKNIKILN